jgi:hypothetical protein
MSAWISQKHSTQFDFQLTVSRVKIDDLICQHWNVNTCITLSGEIKVVTFILRESVEKLLQCLQVIFGCLSVISIFVRFTGVSESNTGWRLKIYDIGPLVPAVGVDVHLCCSWFEQQRAVLCQHANH